jgi:putative lipoprotein
MGLIRIVAMLFALAAATLPALATDVTFSGIVAYRERIALPPDATLAISLVHLPDGRRVAGAQTGLGAKSGSPVQFTLHVRSNVLKPNQAYGLLATIRHQGRQLFANSVPTAVHPLAPTDIVIPVQFAPAAQEAQAAVPVPAAPNPLLDTIWSVTSIGGDPVLPGSDLTFSITADLRVGGRGGCNSYFTEASFEPGPLSFGPVAGTRMACDPAAMAQEARFFAALAATAGYELDGDVLRLLDAAGVPLIGLVRQP